MTSADKTAIELAELRVEVRAYGKALERVATAVEKLSAIEAQNVARDEKLAALAKHNAELADKLEALDKRTGTVETRITAWGAVLGFIATVGPFLAKKLGWFE